RRPKCTKARSRRVWGTDSAAGAMRTAWRRPRWKAWRQREAMWDLSAVGISSGTRSASTGGWRTRHGVERRQPASQNACTTYNLREALRMPAMTSLSPRRIGRRPKCSSDFVLWPIATDDALTANRRFRGIADMDRFSSRNDLLRMTLMYGPAARRKRFHRSAGFAVLHQCIRPLIGACRAPGHHGYQRACVLIKRQASDGPNGSRGFACAGKTGPPSRFILSQTSAGKRDYVIALS